MFSFFKKKKPPEVQIATEVPVTPSEPQVVAPVIVPTPILPIQESPTAKPAETFITRPVAESIAAIVEDIKVVEVIETAPVADQITRPIAPPAMINEVRVDAFVPPSDLAQPQERPKLSWTERLKMGLAKTRDKLGKSLASVFGGGKIDEDLYEELETVLLTADMGIDATQHLLKDVRERVSLRGLKDSGELKEALKSSLTKLIQPLEIPLDVSGHKPFILMVAGVNGAGKTTSIGKLAKYFQSQNLSVLLAAGDTFRAAAREQLVVWGERNGVQVIAQASGDAAAVAFDAVNAAKARGIDVVIVDTAGRLPTQLHLMEEIKKVKRVVQKADPTGPHEILLVLDANTGQNALSQVKSFDDALGLTGLVLTKLDGTAKGGIIAAIAKNRPVPLRFIGIGETIDDLRPFVAKDYIDALFE